MFDLKDTAVFLYKAVIHIYIFYLGWFWGSKLIAKFVVSRCPFANFVWVFLFRQSFEWGGVNANHNATHSLSLAGKNKTENYSRLLKNSEGNRDHEWNFCRGQEAAIALFLQCKRQE